MANASHNSTTTKRAPGVKLTEHSKGWVAKIGGKVKWLAPLDKPQLAMERYHQKMSAYRASLVAPPPVADNNVTLNHIGQLFIDAKFAKVKAGELKPRTYHGYEQGLIKALDFFGTETPALSITVGRWQQYRGHLSETCDIYTIARHVGAIRSLSKWAVQNEYIDRPFRFGTEFNLPSQKALRSAKAVAGDRTYTVAQVKKVLASKSAVLKAMFLLSLNGGIGNTDISDLEDANIKGNCVEFSRSKTGVARVVPLWAETEAAIKEARVARPAPHKPEWAGRIFLTERGHPYVRDNFDDEGNLTSTTDKISSLFWKELKAIKVPRSFYDGRRTFQTIGDEVGPPHVVRFIMGHATRGDDMSSRYRQSIPHSQLLAVVTHVRTRLHVEECFASARATSSRKAGSRAKARPVAKPGKPPRRQSKNAR